MIELKGLSKRYGPTLAVDDLSFQVQSGKVTGFLGPNGAGKSTAAPTRSSAPPSGSWGPCWTPGRSIRAAPPAATCWPWR
jgi:ABC-type branched-subunit amino acid transport system ATPase component